MSGDRFGSRLSGCWRRVVVLVGFAQALAACAPGQQVYTATGVVQAVDGATRQLTIAHEDITGFMPAMTMSFDAAESVPLDSLAPGDQVRFRLERTGSSLRVLSAEKIGTGVVSAGIAGIAAAPEQQPAPDFELIDQDGRQFALRDLRGSAVLLDFIFTRCAGPCPILTAQHAELQRSLEGRLRACTRFVSISVDPEYDRPHLLREYGRARGADLREWWFLTGPPEEVHAVLAAYGVGASRVDPQNLVHLVATYLIDPRGRIAHRYAGLEHSGAQLRADLTAVCS
jgi:protein SCO1/2